MPQLFRYGPSFSLCIYKQKHLTRYMDLNSAMIQLF